jgi:hypothetical protein
MALSFFWPLFLAPPAAARPQLVTDSLAESKPLYYFGLGSNMLRSKLENRSSNGTIEILSMEPAVVHGHRLAFNMRAFPPLEPGMGSLEPIDSNSKALLAFDKPECHGALVQVSSEDYIKLMASEGVGLNTSTTGNGYEEVVVQAVPYDTNYPPVQAIALRAVRPLRKDPAPSERYMMILRQGAAELGLTKDYQLFLQNHPSQVVPRMLQRIAVYNLIGMFSINQLFKTWRGVSQLQSRLLYLVYVPSTILASGARRKWSSRLSIIVQACILLPGFVLGWTLRNIVGAQESPFVKRMLEIIDKQDKTIVEKTNQAQTTTTD